MTVYDELVRRAAAARRCAWSIPEENHPDGSLCRMEGHCIDAARAMLDAAGVPALLASASDSEGRTSAERFADLAAAQFRSDLDYDGAEVKRRIEITAHILAPDHPANDAECAVCVDDDRIDLEASDERRTR